MTTSNEGCIIVFGATGGVGSALAEQLHQSGKKVFLAGRNIQKLDELSARLQAPTANVDATSPESFEKAVDLAKSEFSSVSGIANCIGTVFLKPVSLTSNEAFWEVIQANLGSSFAILKAGMKAMKANGGSMVFFSTAATRIGMPNHEAIAAAKGGIEGMALSAAASCASRGIRINVIAPGLVQTEMTRSIWDNETNAKVSKEMHALGRFGKAEEIASAAEFLLAPENSWITGQVIGVDGGLGTLMPRRKA